MKSRAAIGIAVSAALAVLLTALPPIVEKVSPSAGLVRSVFTQRGFGGAPIESRTSAIDLGFLDEDASLPRQNFSARWRGFFYVRAPQTVEFFAGGNDEVELRVNGDL